jgi:hypothetical protein
MDKEAIADLIEEKHTHLIAWLEQQPDKSWVIGPTNK